MSAAPEVLPELVLGARLETLQSVAGAKAAWISELQGGSARTGFMVTDPVGGPRQQRWIWSAFARGIKAVIFWCWRDAEFGHESSGFGLAGADGLSAERLEYLADTSRIVGEHREALAGYRPDLAKVAVLFSPRAYQLTWAQEGTARAAADATLGWMLSLERAQLPYRVLDAQQFEQLADLKILVLPWPLIIGEEVGSAIVKWVAGGGTLVTEAELDAYSEQGFYRQPADRPLAQALGIAHMGRRPLDSTVTFEFGHGPARTGMFLEALADTDGQVLMRSGNGEALALRRRVGHGEVIALGGFPGQEAVPARSRPLEDLLREVAATSGSLITAQPSDGEQLQWRLGTGGGGERLLFLCSERSFQSVVLTVSSSLLPSTGPLHDWLDGRKWEVEHNGTERKLIGSTGRTGVAVLAWPSGDD